MIRAVFLLFIALCIGGIVHIAALMMIPVVAPKSAYKRIEAFLPLNAFSTLGIKQAVLPNRDPAFEYRFCRFDLRDGPLSITAPVDDNYYALSFYAHDSVAFYGLNQRSALGGKLDIVLHSAAFPPPEDEATPTGAIVLSSPTPIGFIVAKAFVGTESQRQQARNLVDQASCNLTTAP